MRYPQRSDGETDRPRPSPFPDTSLVTLTISWSHSDTHTRTSSALSTTQLTEPAESGGNTRQRGDPSEPDNTRTLTSETSWLIVALLSNRRLYWSNIYCRLQECVWGVPVGMSDVYSYVTVISSSMVSNNMSLVDGWYEIIILYAVEDPMGLQPLLRSLLSKAIKSHSK